MLNILNSEILIRFFFFKISHFVFMHEFDGKKTVSFLVVFHCFLIVLVVWIGMLIALSAILWIIFFFFLSLIDFDARIWIFLYHAILLKIAWFLNLCAKQMRYNSVFVIEIETMAGLGHEMIKCLIDILTFLSFFNWTVSIMGSLIVSA